MIDSIRLFSHEGQPLGELSKHAGTLESCVMSLEINGEHSLSIETKRALTVGMRAVTCEPSGRYREWVVDEVDNDHVDTMYGTGSYHLIWSLQYDLKSTNAGTIQQPGVSNGRSGTSATNALRCALEGTCWEVGTVEPTTRTWVIMNFNSAWDRLDQVVKHWGGEIDDHIAVLDAGVVTRKVNLLRHIGDTDATRRLEWRHDLTSISRSPSPGPYYCRVIPLGSGESIDADDGESTISSPLTIGKFGMNYLNDKQAEGLFRINMGNGQWIYPTIAVSYSTDDPNELLTLAHEDLHNHTRPGVSYSGTISQFVEAGMDADVDLGDEVQIVDYGFSEERELRVEERVLKIEIDLINGNDKKLTIGKFKQSLERSVANIASAVSSALGDSIIADEIRLDDFEWVDVNVPQYDPMTIDTPDGEYTIDPAEYSDLDLSQYMPDELEQRLQDIEDLVSELTGIEYDPDSGLYYDRDGNLLNDSLINGDPDMFVGDTTKPTDSGVSMGMGDGWVHQIDGVTQASGTINFVTTKGGGSSGGGSSSGSSNNEKKTTWTTNALNAGKKLAKQIEENKKKKNNATTRTEAKKQTFAVTAANIPGQYDVNYHGTDTTYNELFGKSNDDEGFTSIDDFFGWSDFFGY